VRFLIDGNNAWHALRRQLAVPVGRQEFASRVGRWASAGGADVVIVFDGRAPGRGLVAQMELGGVRCVFGNGREADEVIEEEIAATARPAGLCVVTEDKAILSAARRRRCRTMTSTSFVEQMAVKAPRPRQIRPAPSEKPSGVEGPESKAWMREFGFEPGEA
jgi:predicted RNA-binding protein with PIN domain